MDMPTTRKALCKYINTILYDLLDEAKDNDEHYADITFPIKGDCEFIYNYIEDMCHRYNEKNDIWKCDVEHIGDETEYTLRVCHTDDSADRFGWISDDDDTPLCENA